MSIKDFAQKIKLFLANAKDKIYSQEKGLKIKDDIYIVLLIVFVGISSYGLGKISAYEKNKEPISILKTQEYIYSTLNSTSSSETNSGEVMASKNGTKYYYPWCSGASRISDQNKVWFNTIDDAKSAGLTPASNCTGLK